MVEAARLANMNDMLDGESRKEGAASFCSKAITSLWWWWAGQ